MRFRSVGVSLLLFALVLFFSSDAGAVGRRAFGKSKGKPAQQKKPGMPNGKEKPFEELIKDQVAIEGLFTFYFDSTENKYLMAVKPEHIGPNYLMAMGRTGGDGSFYDTGPIGPTFPFYLQRVGKEILFIEKNLRVRADEDEVAQRAIKKAISDHLYATLPIISLPQDSTDAVLVDPSPLFIRDAENTNFYLGQLGRTGIAFDGKNSYIEAVKSFPMNSEISVKLHFRGSRPISTTFLENSESFYNEYHYSMSTLPESDYVPRLSDPRVGYFETIYMDYDDMDTENPYTRYIDRWNLKKKNPEARVSEPVKPIVFWVENTVPVEYRDAFAEGIEFWNQCFEKLGYRNAIIAKQMPDTADWDPLDVRYNTVRWMISPGGYAIGPHRANPFTGEILDADISVSSEFIRYMFTNAENFIEPSISFDGQIDEPEDLLNQHLHDNEFSCTYAKEGAKEAAFGLSYVLATAGDLVDKSDLTKKYIHEYIVELVAHEVGHTLGFRHNFKASSIYSLEQIQDPNFTKVNGTVGTIMDYAPPNIALKGQKQGEFYASAPGPFDHWRVEYGYTDFGAATPQDEVDQLQEIASRSADPLLAYGTDQDVSATSVDPMTNTFDLGDDQIKYCEHKIGLTKDLWNNEIQKFEKKGTSFEKLRLVFGYGWRSYRESALYASRFIGGIYHNKSFIGDGADNVPFRPVPASEQKRALNFINKNIFAPDAFNLPDGLLNKLQSLQSGTFSESPYNGVFGYQWHQRVANVQATVLYYLYRPQTIERLMNNVERYDNPAEMYTMYDMFNDVRNMVWTEVANQQNVNSYRRQLQLLHLNRLINIYLASSMETAFDARSLAANDLDIIKANAEKSLKSNVNGMTKAHLKEVIRQIEAAQKANRDYSIFGL